MNPDNPPNPLSRRWWEPSLRRSWKELFCGCLVLISLLCIPKATLRLDDTLMGLMEVRKAIIVTSPTDDSKKRLRSAKGNRAEGRVQAQASGSPLQVESQALDSSTNDIWQRAWNLVNQETHPSHGVQGFFWGNSHVRTWGAHMTELRCSGTSSSRGQANTVQPNAPTINHLVSADYLAWSQAPDIKRYSFKNLFNFLFGI